MLKKLKLFRNWPVAILLVFIFFLYSYNLTGWLMHDDEGGYLYQSWRMTEGEIPYKDFYSPKEPLFLFTGYLIFKLFGPAVFWARMFSVLATILTGYLIFLIGRRVYNYTIGLLGAVFYLILPVVFFQARLFRSDAYAVLFSTLGLFLFIRAWQEKRRSLFAWAGISYALAICYKFSGVLGALAILLFVAYQAATEKKPQPAKRYFLYFISGLAGVLFMAIVLLFSISPGFIRCLIAHQVNQPLLAGSSILTTIAGNLGDLFMTAPRQFGRGDNHTLLIIFSLPLLTGYLFGKNEVKKILSFYAVGLVILLFNPYPGALFRYTLYILPTTVLVFGSIAFYAFDWKRKVLIRAVAVSILAFCLLKVFVPGLFRVLALSGLREQGTLALAEYVKTFTSKDDYVASDYGDTLFYARRKTTPSLAAMSKSTVECGAITGEKLIAELEKYRVRAVLMHREGNISADIGVVTCDLFEPHHFKALLDSADGDRFMLYLHEHYSFMGNFRRNGQLFDVYVRK